MQTFVYPAHNKVLLQYALVHFELNKMCNSERWRTERVRYRTCRERERVYLSTGQCFGERENGLQKENFQSHHCPKKTHTHTHSGRGGLVRHTERERERLVFVGSRDQLMESELCHFDTGVVLLHNIKVNNTDKPLVQLGGRLNQENVLQVPHFDQHPQICLFFEVNTLWQTKLCNLQENQANCAILEETKNSTMKIWSIYINIHGQSLVQGKPYQPSLKPYLCLEWCKSLTNIVSYFFSHKSIHIDYNANSIMREKM